MSKKCPECGVPMEGPTCSYCGYDENKRDSLVPDSKKSFFSKNMSSIIAIVAMIAVFAIVGSRSIAPFDKLLAIIAILVIIRIVMGRKKEDDKKNKN